MTAQRPEDSHLAREVAESFGSDAVRYDRARPSYPDALIDAVLAEAPGTNVLDIGTGTGIIARQFLQRGCTVLGIDPDPRMAARASATGVAVEVSSIEAWEPAGRHFDAAVAGMTWHWVDPVKGAAKAREALVDGGLLALFWNVAQAPSELDEGFRRGVPPGRPRVPRLQLGRPRRARIRRLPRQGCRRHARRRRFRRAADLAIRVGP